MIIIILAALLLILRFISTGYLIKVIQTQRELMKRPVKTEYQGITINDPEITKFRSQLFYLTVAFAGSNLVPVAFDLFVIFRELDIFSPGIPFLWIMTAYAFSNALSMILAGYLLFKMYEKALQTDQANPSSDHSIMSNENKERHHGASTKRRRR